jgi:hypothetical protein
MARTVQRSPQQRGRGERSAHRGLVNLEWLMGDRPQEDHIPREPGAVGLMGCCKVGFINPTGLRQRARGSLGQLVEAAAYYGELPAELKRWPDGRPGMNSLYRRVYADELNSMSELAFLMAASCRARQPTWWADLAATAAVIREPAPCLACLRALRHGLESGSGVAYGIVLGFALLIWELNGFKYRCRSCF